MRTISYLFGKRPKSNHELCAGALPTGRKARGMMALRVGIFMVLMAFVMITSLYCQ